jgi:hypothetical protein
MELRKAIEQDDHDEVINIVDKLLFDESKADLVPSLKSLKLIALIKSEKFDNALEHIKLNLALFKSADNFKFVQNYVLYKKEKYDEVIKNIGDQPVDVQTKLLIAQTQAKMENFAGAFKSFYSLLNNSDIDGRQLREDLITNIVNTLILVLLTENASSAFAKDKDLLVKAGDFVTMIASYNYADVGMRELCINVLLLLIIVEKTKVAGLDKLLDKSFDFNNQTDFLLKRIEKMIDEEQGNDSKGMQIENDAKGFEALSGENLTDQLTLYSLRALLMQKKQKIVWNNKDIEALEQIIFTDKNKIKDQQLKISILSFLAFIQSVSQEEETGNLDRLIALFDEEIKGLKKGSKIAHFLQEQILFNKVILLLHRNNLAEARRILKNELKFQERVIDYNYLPIETHLIAKTKNYKDFESKLACFTDQDLAENSRIHCVYYLFQLAVFYNLNNQKRYFEVFNEFLNTFFIPQLSLPVEMRFLSPVVFTQFAKNVVFYLLRNSNILKNLKEKIVALLDYIEDTNVVTKVAEGFIEKKDYQVAEKILRDVLQRNPNNEKVISRLNYIYSVIAPEKINDALLPQFDLIRDFNTLRNLENDFMNIIRQHNTGKVELTDISKPAEGNPNAKKRVKKTKKYRIKWPKNFDFNNPGPRPDPERWLPKYERKKYRKIAMKKGLVSKTQGGTNYNAEQTKELFRLENSTANQAVSKQRGKKR